MSHNLLNSKGYLVIDGLQVTDSATGQPVDLSTYLNRYIMSVEIGDISSLLTINKGNLVSSVNEIYNNIGLPLSSLTTTDKTSIVSAINEIQASSGGGAVD